ncbi:ExeM/NucH family extracellular endonuclease [Pseudochelatococcus sp. B33]
MSQLDSASNGDSATSVTFDAEGDAPQALLISQIQGTATASTYIGNYVLVSAIVTYKTVDGFFLQEEDSDADDDAATSEGIFVYTGGAPTVAVGDHVNVSGTVDEYFNLTQIKDVTDIVTLSSGNGQPTPAVIALSPDFITDLERFEGQLVTLTTGTELPLTVIENFNFDRYGEIVVSAGGQVQPTQIFDPNTQLDEIHALQQANANNRFKIDDGNPAQNPIEFPYAPAAVGDNGNGFIDAGDTFSEQGPTLRLGAELTGPVTGVLTYNFNEYKLLPIGLLPIDEATNGGARPQEPEDVGGRLTVASFNLLNYFTTLNDGSGNGSGPENLEPRGATTESDLQRQTDKIVTALLKLDGSVIGLQELENNGFSDASAIAVLVNALNARAPDGTVYAFVNPTAADSDGFIGTDAITTGLIYKTNEVSVVASDIFVFDEGGQQSTRPAVTATFEEAGTGERFTVSVNHFKSKSGTGKGADADQGDGQGAFNATRVETAHQLTEWLDIGNSEGYFAKNGITDPDVLILGDLNSYAKEDPISAIRDAGYVDLIDAHIGQDEAFSYLFDGQRGTLDQGLANGSLAAQVTGVAEWHINSQEPDLLNYSSQFTDPRFFNDDVFATSDHDPVVIGLNLSTPTPDIPQIIAHRGASGYRPEHTIEAYKLAIEMGAQVIEPDIVVTKDGHLIARHENLLNETTDVSERPEFEHLYTTKNIDGTEVSGWFAEDFTLAEIKTLWARERIPEIRPESAAYNDQFRIATLEEVIALVNEVEQETGKKIAIAPETKHPTFFQYTGQYVDGEFIHVNTSQLLVDKLVDLGFTERDRVYIQSFEVANLIELGTKIQPEAGVDFKLVQLLGGAFDIYFHFTPEFAELGANPDIYKDFDFPLTRESALNTDLYTPQAAAAIAKLYGDALAPAKDAVLQTTGLLNPVDANGDGIPQVTRIISNILDLPAIAHAVGLESILWTVRADEPFLALNPDGTLQLPVEEIVRLFDFGIDALFTDFPDLGRTIADQYKAGDGAIAAHNFWGGNDILVRDVAGFTAEKGTDGFDLAVYYGDQAIVLPDTVEALRLNGSNDVVVVGNGLDNVLLGNAGNNRFVESAGNDRIDGGTGRDILILAGAKADYTIEVKDGLVHIANAATGGLQRVSNIETLVYADQTDDLLAAGQSDIQGLYHAFLGREADGAGFDFWLGESLAGQDVWTISARFAEAEEFHQYSEGLDNAAFIDALYTTVLERAGEEAGRQYWIGQLDEADASRADVALFFAQSDEAQSRVSLLTPPSDLWTEVA